LIRLNTDFLEALRLGNTEVRVGRPLPWSLFDSVGRLLMRRGMRVETPEQLVALSQKASYRTGDDSGAARREKDKAPFFAIGEMMGRLSSLLSALAEGRADVIAPLKELATAIQVMCAADADAALAAIHLDRDGKYAVRHLIHGALLVELVAYRLGYSPDQRHVVICATLTANVGMLELQERLLQQGPITPEQRREINEHPARSVELLRAAGVEDDEWLESVLQHHERMDGSGYPRGLEGEAMRRGARLIALADIYHAKISDRVYRAAMAPTQALREVFLAQGKDVDQELSRLFIKELGVYPPGGFVKLANGELAVVTHRGRDGISPRVASVLTPRGAPYARPLPRDTDNKDCAIRETARRDESILLTDLLPLWGY
jgi:HD-GYP domain-containing protein (c-di-GMP phosphodiesterase class II)